MSVLNDTESLGNQNLSPRGAGLFQNAFPGYELLTPQIDAPPVPKMATAGGVFLCEPQCGRARIARELHVSLENLVRLREECALSRRLSAY